MDTHVKIHQAVHLNRSEITRGLMFVLFLKYTSFSTIKPYSLQKKIAFGTSL